MTVHHQTNDPFENKTEEIELKEGEFICDVCDGTGKDPGYEYSYWPYSICPKCQGEKKLDWVSIATGVPKKIDPQHFHSSSGHGVTGCTQGHIHALNTSPSKMILDSGAVEIDNKSIKDYIQDVVAEKLAIEIDKHIMEALQNQEEQINKKRRKFFDNRIFSKFMFFRNFKQRVKDKKDKNII